MILNCRQFHLHQLAKLFYLILNCRQFDLYQVAKLPYHHWRLFQSLPRLAIMLISKIHQILFDDLKKSYRNDSRAIAVLSE